MFFIRFSILFFFQASDGKSRKSSFQYSRNPKDKILHNKEIYESDDSRNQKWHKDKDIERGNVDEITTIRVKCQVHREQNSSNE